MRPLRRAIIAVVALYALLLQPFLALAAPLVPAALHGVLCAPDGDPVPGRPAAHDHACCTVAPVAGPAPPATASDAGLRPRPRTWAALAWHPGDDPGPARPPTRAHAPRGPPPA